MEWEEPARHFLLSALLSARALELGLNGSHGLELTYLAPTSEGIEDGGDAAPNGSAAETAPVSSPLARRAGTTARALRLILRADTEEERLKWIEGLQARIRWQAACVACGRMP